MSDDKEEITQSEREQVKLAKAVSDRGFALSKVHAGGQRGDMRYDSSANKSGKASAARALNLKNRLAQGRVSGERVANSVGANSQVGANQFSSIAESGLSQVGRGSGSVTRGARQLTRTGMSNSRRHAGEERSDALEGQRKNQGLMDLASVAMVSGAGKYWDSQKADDTPQEKRVEGVRSRAQDDDYEYKGY